MAEPFEYRKVTMLPGVFGNTYDMCLTCGAILPRGIEVGGVTPTEAHTRFHASMELTVQVVDALGADLRRRADYEEEMQERSGG